MVFEVGVGYDGFFGKKLGSIKGFVVLVSFSGLLGIGFGVGGFLVVGVCC